MSSAQLPLSASSIAKMKLMAADHELSQALVKVALLLIAVLIEQITGKENQEDTDKSFFPSK